MQGALKRSQLTVLWIAILLVLQTGFAHANPYWSPWYKKDTSIVVDAYAYSPIDWDKFVKNKRLVGFINKASDGLSPPWRCKGNETMRKLCNIAWRQHKAEEELFLTRRHLAKSKGLKWGSYHLGRAGNPIQQALHYLSYAKPQKDELIALDIEDIKPGKWMSLKDAEIFARFIKLKIGRYPLLYTNHATAKHIAQNKDKYRLLSRLNLWYARYKTKIPGAFPMGNWESYTMWQFASQHNCERRRRRCPWRMRGTDRKIDVNVVAMSQDKLRKAWPFTELTAKVRKEPEVVAKLPVARPEVAVTPTVVEQSVAKVETKPVVKREVVDKPSPPHPDADRKVVSKPVIERKRPLTASIAIPEIKVEKPEERKVADVPSPAAPTPEITAVSVSPESNEPQQKIEKEQEIDPKYRITGRIPLPERPPIFMEVEASDAPLPKRRPYHVSDGPQHKFMDDVLASLQLQQPGS